jgi:chromosome partitioning protein
MCKVIACVNEKGGVAKTTTIKNLSVGLALKGRKVLVIDLDASANLTDALGVTLSDDDKTICDIFAHVIEGRDKDIDPLPEGFAVKHIDEGIDVIPSEEFMHAAESMIERASFKETLLKDYIDTIRDSYDFIFLDCPAGLGVTVINALYTSDAIIIPTQAHYLSIEALQNVFSKLSMIWRHTGSEKPFILGILFTWFRGYTTNDTQILEKMLEQFSNVPFFKTKIPQFTVIPESDVAKQSIFSYKPNHPAAAVYSDLVDEFFDKVDQLEKKGQR